MAKNLEDTFSLEIFEGPLPFLLHLVQKSEISIHDVPISEITRQYLERIEEWIALSVDNGAEFISATAMLLLLKSRYLLPKPETAEEEEENFEATVEMMQKLLEYCHFKEAAKDLALREEKQRVFFNRGSCRLPGGGKQLLGIEHLSMQDLEALFQQVVQKRETRHQKIVEEEWHVPDKILALREMLKERAKVPFGSFFSEEMSQKELIVSFLALLELMKAGGCFVGRENRSESVWIFKGPYDSRG